MKKVPILLKRISRKESRSGTLTIGVIGTHHGTGVTHLSILLANYLSEWMGKKVAYVEYGQQNDIKYMEQIYEETHGSAKEHTKEEEFFLIHRVAYYKSIRPADLAMVIGSSYDCIILDLGMDFTKNKHEFFRCDRKFVVSSLTPWKQQELERFYEHTRHINQSDEWLYMIPFGESREIKQAAKEFRKQFWGIPYEPDPFSLSEETIHFFQKII
jgi:hypothetical protein